VGDCFENSLPLIPAPETRNRGLTPAKGEGLPTYGARVWRPLQRHTQGGKIGIEGIQRGRNMKKPTAQWPRFTEADVDRCFMAVMKQYRRTLPKGLRQPLFAARHRLLKWGCELSPAEQIEVTNVLWQHCGTILEEGYYLKEDLKALLHSRNRAERDARRAQVMARWKSSSLAGTPLAELFPEGTGNVVSPRRSPQTRPSRWSQPQSIASPTR